LYSYIQVIGGNKHRGGFIYKLTGFGSQTDIQNRIEQDIQATLKNVWNEYNKENNYTASEEQEQEPPPTEEPQEQGADYTYKKMVETCQTEPDRVFTVHQVYTLTGRTQRTENRHLKTLWEQGRLNRQWKDRQYHYTLAPKQDSKTVSQNPMTDSQTQ
jgi:predicted transcriptional regulator YdeE